MTSVNIERAREKLLELNAYAIEAGKVPRGTFRTAIREALEALEEEQTVRQRHDKMGQDGRSVHTERDRMLADEIDANRARIAKLEARHAE